MAEPRLLFSVIVPTYSRARLLQRCLAALAFQTYPHYEVIVVDDGSEDGTEELVRLHFPRVLVLSQPHSNPATARNLGIAHARGEVIAFTDDDCQVPEDWLEKLANGYARYPEVSGVGGYLEPAEEALSSSPWARYDRYAGREFLGAGSQERLGGMDCPIGDTGNISYRREVLASVGGFDERLPFGASEDFDLKLRVCQQGHRLLYLPLKVTHLREYSWAEFKQRAYLRGWGRTAYERKHGSSPNHLKVGLRLVKRILTFGKDIILLPDKPLAYAKLMHGIYSCWGQFRSL